MTTTTWMDISVPIYTGYELIFLPLKIVDSDGALALAILRKIGGAS